MRIVQNQDIAASPAMYPKNGDVKVTSIFRTLQGEAPFTGVPAVFLRLAGCNYGTKTNYCQFCFPEDKMLSTPQGARAFKDIKKGDLLYTLDDDFNLTTTEVKKVMRRDVTRQEMVRITYKAVARFGGKEHTKSIVCTTEHPFHVKGKGFVAAKDLDLDDVIYHVKSNEIMSLQKKLNNPMRDPAISKKALDKLRARRASGATVVGVEYLSNKAWSNMNLKDNGKLGVVNFSCAPYNTFIVDNLHTHNCDTSFQLENATTYSPENLIEQLKATKQGQDILVLTGGEPSLQANIIPVLVRLLELGVFSVIQIETNLTNPSFWETLHATGRVVRTPNEKGIYVVGSPKANYKTNKTNKPSTFLLENVLGCVKVLVDGDGTPNANLPEWLKEANTYVPVYLSPIAVYNKAYEGEVSSIWDEGLVNKTATQNNYQKAARLAIDNGYMLSLQTHLFTSIP